MPATAVRPTWSRADLRLAGLTVVLPCFDEEENVEAAVAAALVAAERWADAAEVIVVDDGSGDATRERARRCCEQDARVRLVCHERNRGYGAALRSGIDASRMPWVLLTDADLQFDLDEIEHFLELTGSNDMVAGYRLERDDPAHRRAAAHAWNRLVRRTFGVAVRDVDCAFKLVRGPALRELGLCSEGAMVSTELYARAAAARWRIAEVGVTHRARQAGTATGGDVRVIARAFAEHRAVRRALRAEPVRGRARHPLGAR